MTNHSIFNKLKNKIAIILAVVCVFCMSIFCLTACSKNTTPKEPTYSYTEPADKYIANSNFTSGTANKKFDGYPVTTPTGWTKSYHKQAISSYVDSGVIDVSPEGWTALKSKLSGDADLIKALAEQLKETVIEDIRAEKNDTAYNPSSNEISDYVKNNIEKYFANPNTPTTANEGKIYMLNNYPQSSKYIGTGTAQTLTSSSTITLEKGKIAKISVFVKTLNITGQGPSENHGANIRLTNTINGKSQPEYRISSIIANDWTEYIIYVKADSNYDSTINVALGLGYGQGSNTATEFYTQGTAFFDNLSYEVLDSIETVDQTSQYYVDFGGKNPLQLQLGKETEYEVFATSDNTNYLYDMTINYATGYFNTITSADFSGLKSSNDYFNYSNIIGPNGQITSKDIYANGTITVDTSTNDKVQVTLDKASASVKLANASEFVLDSDEYAILTFKVKNQLSLLGNNDLTLNLFDVNGTDIEKRAINFTSNRSEDEILVTLFINNNFENVDNRQFYLVFNIGLADIATAKYSSDLSSGTVTISEIALAKGTISDKDADTYKYYEFLNSSATDNLVLYAGNFNDFNDTAEKVTSHKLTTKPSDFGTIRNYPANVKDFEGVVSNHQYITENGTEKKVDTRSGVGDGQGNYAGLINTSYLNEYKANTGLNDIESALGDFDDEIQPIMIYNSTSDSYGFITDKKNILADQYAKITAKVRVVGDAVAYLYLIDVSKAEKEVLTFSSFTPNVNANEIGGNTVGEINKNNSLEKLFLRIDASTLANKGEDWVEVNFYLGVGATDKQVRLEVWNGSRDGAEKSQGYVFFNDIEIVTESGFNQSGDWGNALFTDKDNPLYGFDVNENSNYQLIAYRQELTADEKKFNAEYANDSSIDKREYKINYIWAKTDTMVYAIYNTIEPNVTNPYDSLPKEENNSGCTSPADPSTFWLSFSSILLGVCLLFALTALIVKIIVRKKKANQSDAKSHYKVTSRIKKKTENKTEKESVEEFIEEINEEIQEETETVDTEVENNENEQSLDEYVYGDVVEDFDDKNEEKNSNEDNTEK